MKRRDYVDLLLLAAIWGAGFLFMRMGAGEFGGVALGLIRAAGGALVLMPIVLWRGEWPALKVHWRTILAIGLTNSAVPFVLFGFAAMTLGAGISSIFNATTPLWVALIARAWLGDRLGWQRLLGLVIGTFGVAWLASHQGRLAATGEAVGWAAAAALAATALYGYSAVFTRRYMVGVPTMALAGGSQLVAALALLVPGVWQWPSQPPSLRAWGAMVGLAVLCTGVAYAMFFRLIGRIGPANTASVAYLIPAFGVVWGMLVLDEVMTPGMLVGCAIVLVGVALTTGLLSRRPVASPPPRAVASGEP